MGTTLFKFYRLPGLGQRMFSPEKCVYKCECSWIWLQYKRTFHTQGACIPLPRRALHNLQHVVHGPLTLLAEGTSVWELKTLLHKILHLILYLAPKFQSISLYDQLFTSCRPPILTQVHQMPPHITWNTRSTRYPICLFASVLVSNYSLFHPTTNDPKFNFVLLDIFTGQFWDKCTRWCSSFSKHNMTLNATKRYPIHVLLPVMFKLKP